MTEVNPSAREEIFLTVENGSIEGYIQRDEATATAILDYVAVDDIAQGQGKAKELVQLFTAQAQSEGAASLETTVIEPALFHILATTFGQESLHLLSADDSRTPLDIDYDQASAQLRDMAEIAAQHEEQDADTPDDQRTGIRVVVDLTNPDALAHLARSKKQTQPE